MSKTLEKLKEYIESGAYKYSSPMIGKEEVDCCIEALEKQEAKEIHIYANGEEHCPTCDENLTGLGFKRCIECGQLLK